VSFPKGWILSKLGDVTTYKKGKKPKILNVLQEEGLVPYIDIKAFEKGIIRQYADIESSVLVDKDNFLIVWDGARSGLTGRNMTGALGSTIMKVDASGFDNDYIFRFFQFKYADINSNTKGTGIPHVDPTYLWNLDIPIPPLNEQKRIAKKLDELLATVESIKTRLDNAPNIIKRFRQSILAAATSGKLTEEWREENGVSDKWDELTVDDVAKVGTGNTPLKSNIAFYENADIPWLTSSVTGSPYVREADKFVTQTAIDECRLKLYPSGTLLVAMYGEGKTRGQVTELTFPASINQACAAIMIDEEKIEKSYLKMRLQENYAEIRMLAEGGNQPNLNLSKVRSITVPTPSIEEQKEIVSQVKSLFTLADTLEAKIEAAKKRVDRLSQSILAKAFSGELVPQDPSDEPAEKILERIKAGQEKEKAKKTRKKK